MLNCNLAFNYTGFVCFVSRRNRKVIFPTFIAVLTSAEDFCCWTMALSCLEKATCKSFSSAQYVFFLASNYDEPDRYNMWHSIDFFCPHSSLFLCLYIAIYGARDIAAAGVVGFPVQPSFFLLNEIVKQSEILQVHFEKKPISILREMFPFLLKSYHRPWEEECIAAALDYSPNSVLRSNQSFPLDSKLVLSLLWPQSAIL